MDINEARKCSANEPRAKNTDSHTEPLGIIFSIHHIDKSRLLKENNNRNRKKHTYEKITTKNKKKRFGLCTSEKALGLLIPGTND